MLRALARTPEARDALLAELELARGGDPRLDAELDALASTPIDVTDEAGARLLAGRLARALQASLLVRSAPAAVADGFCATRLGAPAGQTFGELPAGIDVAAIVERARPDQAA